MSCKRGWDTEDTLRYLATQLGGHSTKPKPMATVRAPKTNPEVPEELRKELHSNPQGQCLMSRVPNRKKGVGLASWRPPSCIQEAKTAKATRHHIGQ
eukprot:2567136-Amphidinium_carterae.1